MRNPWGKESFDGNWSDYSDYWTNKFRKEVGSVRKDDGIFYMEIADYYRQVKETYISFDVSDWFSASFL